MNNSNPDFQIEDGLTLDSNQKSYLYKSYLIKSFFEEGVLCTGSDHFDPSNWWTKSDNGIYSAHVSGCHFYASQNLLLIQSEEGNCLLSRDHLLILSDLASQRYLLRLLSELEALKTQPEFLSRELLNSFLFKKKKTKFGRFLKGQLLLGSVAL